MKTGMIPDRYPGPLEIGLPFPTRIAFPINHWPIVFDGLMGEFIPEFTRVKIPDLPFLAPGFQQADLRQDIAGGSRASHPNEGIIIRNVLAIAGME